MPTDGSSTLETLGSYFRHPLREIGHLPPWSLQHTLIVQAILASASGALRALLTPGLWRLFQGVLIFPILVTITSLLLACFFYYFFQLFERRRVRLDRLLTLVAFSNFFFLFTRIVSHVFPPADFLGLAATAMLLVIGLTENFELPKRRSLRLIGTVFGLLFALWLTERITANTAPDAAEDSVATP